MERKIVGFDNYSVSDSGVVMNSKRGKRLSLTTRKDGYVQVGLWKSGKMKQCYVHRLVYEAFNGDIALGLEINHIDGNKANNAISNLECVTRSENQKHAVVHGLRKIKMESYIKASKVNRKFNSDSEREMKLLQ